MRRLLYRPGITVFRRAMFMAIAVCICLATLPLRAEGGFIQAFSGNTAPTDGVRVMSTLNFAVLDGSWDTDYNGALVKNFEAGGKSPIALDTSAEYLYLYQITNDWPNGNPNEIAHTILPLDVPTHDITSWGEFTGLGFSDFAGPVTSSNFFGNVRVRGNPAAASTGVTNPSIVALNAGTYVTPGSISVFYSDFRKKAVFTANWVGTPIEAQQRSELFGFTTDYSPSMIEMIMDGEAPNQLRSIAKGMAPTPDFNATPEPAAATLLGSGMVISWLFLRLQGGGGKGARGKAA
jgi:hypothetical protein